MNNNDEYLEGALGGLNDDELRKIITTALLIKQKRDGSYAGDGRARTVRETVHFASAQADVVEAAYEVSRGKEPREVEEDMVERRVADTGTKMSPAEIGFAVGGIVGAISGLSGGPVGIAVGMGIFGGIFSLAARAGSAIVTGAKKLFGYARKQAAAWNAERVRRANGAERTRASGVVVNW